MAAVRLTPNGVPAGLDGDLNLRPILQVVNLRCVNVDGGPGAARADRWRGLVSDGNETCPAMFAAQLSGLTRSGVIRRGTVVQLDEYVVNVVGGRRLSPASSRTVDRLGAVRAVSARVSCSRDSGGFCLTCEVIDCVSMRFLGLLVQSGCPLRAASPQIDWGLALD
jgi:hypothetical protein